MASIETRHTKSGERRYVVKYRDPAGKSRERWHRRKVDAERFGRDVGTTLDRGTYIDPRAGSILLREHLEAWQGHRHHLRPSTTARDESYIRNHIVPELGDYRLDRLTRTVVKA